MSVRTKTLLGAASAIALFAPTALAQDACDDCAPPALRSHIVIDQIHTDEVWSVMDVVVDETVDAAASSATTVGNSANGLIATGDLEYDAVQQMDGKAFGKANITGDAVTGAATATATTYGNASNSGTWMGSSYAYTDQTMNGDTKARTNVTLDSAGQLATASTAIANVTTTAVEFGDNMSFTEQASNGSVDAKSNILVGTIDHAGAVATTATGNAISSTGSTATSVQGAVQTTSAGGSIAATSNVDVGYADTLVTATTASGNSYVLQNEWGYASLGREGSELYQGNESTIDAQSWVTLDNWGGTAAVSSYGVGNSAVVSNIGSDTALHAIQSNFATVGSQASFTGESMTGGVATLNATAIGNAATATLCTVCGDAALTGTVSQFNSGSVYSVGTMNVPQAGIVVGSASAIGNSATFQSGNVSTGTGGD